MKYMKYIKSFKNNKLLYAFDLDDTLFDYQTVHDKTLIKLFDRISKITNTPVEMVKLAFELAQKEVKKQLIGTAASHNRDLYFQKLYVAS